MSEPTNKCTSCQQKIPVGKYYQLWQDQNKIGDYCSPCWNKELPKCESLIKRGLYKVMETEAERERERAKLRIVLNVWNIFNTRLLIVKIERLKEKLGGVII